MKRKDHDYEILSPAGSEEQLVAAVNNGCDAVYLGLDAFNARMKAQNFNAENVGHYIDFCHFFGVRVYIAVNTSVKNEEFRDAAETLLLAYKNNADGVIVTDPALLRFAATFPKPFEIVASTQLNVHDGFGARFLKSLGATTVVCARECDFRQIADVARQNVKVECFLHGALCICQSGQCLFSSMVGGNSGNRGLCAQPCRKLYKAGEGIFREGGYLLSASDICGLEFAQKLRKIGVTTFKIEGRNRRPEYAAVTAKVYSEFFARDFLPDEKDRENLAEVFNRGNFLGGNYLFGKNYPIVFPYAQNHIGVEAGSIVNGRFFAAKPVSKGDGLKVFCGKKEVCGGLVTQSGTGFVSAEFSGKVTDGMTVRRTTSVDLAHSALSATRKRAVSVSLSAISGQHAILRLDSEGVKVEAESDFVLQSAVSAPTSDEEMQRQLSKTGNLPFEIQRIEVLHDDIFVAKSQINSLRRAAFEKLETEIVRLYNNAFAARQAYTESAWADIDEFANGKASVKNVVQNCLVVVCRSARQVEKCVGSADYVIFKPEVIDIDAIGSLPFCYLDLPSFCDNEYIAALLKDRELGVVCNNVGSVQMAREYHIRYLAGDGLNIFNDRMAEIFDDADAFFYSRELTLSEIAAFSHNDGLTFVDGELPLMRLVHCPYKLALNSTCDKCKADSELTYTDESGNRFYIRRRRDSRCSFELVNGKKLSVAQRLKNGGRFCVDFEEKVIEHYQNLNCGKIDDFAEMRPYTKGRLFNKTN